VRYLLLCCLTNIPPCTAETPVGLKQPIRRSVMQIIPEPCDHIGCFRPTEFSAAQCRTSFACATIKCSDSLPLPYEPTLPLSIIKFSIRYFQNLRTTWRSVNMRIAVVFSMLMPFLALGLPTTRESGRDQIRARQVWISVGYMVSISQCRLRAQADCSIESGWFQQNCSID
jgi:hypothetical protein